MIILFVFLCLIGFLPTFNIECKTVKKEQQKLSKTNIGKGFWDMKAPKLVGITQWLNSSPLTLEELRGKVVLVDFWTYSCINCVRTLPHVEKWYKEYKDKGFVIVGVHTPEFEFEKNVENVKDAIKRFGITYPVAMDDNYKTWQNYDNHYWPAHYLIDQNGVIRKTHFGEGDYGEMENSIRNLLGLGEISEKEKSEITKLVTPETYLGYERADRYNSDVAIMEDQVATYDYKRALANDHIGLKGVWFVSPKFIQAKSNGAILDLNFMANRVYLVMKSDSPALVDVFLDDKILSSKYYTADMNEKGQIKVHQARMYDVLDLKGDLGRHKLTLQLPKEVVLYVFTFGSGRK